MPLTHTVGREQQKDRPWVVVSEMAFNRRYGLFHAVPLTTKEWSPEMNHVKVPATFDGIDRVALCEQSRSLSELRIRSKAGRVDADILNEIRDKVAYIVGPPQL